MIMFFISFDDIGRQDLLRFEDGKKLYEKISIIQIFMKVNDPPWHLGLDTKSYLGKNYIERFLSTRP